MQYNNTVVFFSSAQEQLCLNLTSSFLHLVQETNSNWQQDFFNDQDASRHHEQNLIRLNQLSSTREDTLSSPPPVTNVQQGLTLLHSVRFISQTRQRNQFVPFVLHNSTGVPLQFSTLTSLPAKVLFNPTAILQQRSRSSLESVQSLSWETVKPGEEKPFDFASGRKLRHQVFAWYTTSCFIIMLDLLFNCTLCCRTHVSLWCTS